MKTLIRIMLVAGFVATLHASIPAAGFTVNVSTTDDSAKAGTGERLAIFSIFQGGDAQTVDSGTLVYGEVKRLQVVDGKIMHELGSGDKTFGTTLADALRAEEPLFVQVALDTPSNVQLPRIEVSSAGRAVLSSDSDRLGGTPAKEYATKSDLSAVMKTSSAGTAAKAPGTGANSTIGGGAGNAASGDYSTVGGGGYNTASGASSTVAGGFQNTASGVGSGVGSGYLNRAMGAYSASAGGSNNTASGGYSSTGGGGGNNAAGVSSTIAGGYGNLATQNGASVGGGVGNRALAEYATIAGGGPHSELEPPGTYFYNTVSDNFGTVGGGAGNKAGDGDSLLYNATYATVAGGRTNTASGFSSAVGGGYVNRATALYSTEAGGASNQANGFSSMVPGGAANVASGGYSFAAGFKANAIHQGAFVWSDFGGPLFPSTNENQFIVRCRGGARFVTAINDTTGNPTAGVTLAGGGGSWLSLSDKNAKTNIVAVNARAILAALASIPISTWNYKTQDEEIRHIGPMAQDFAKAFGVGEDDKHINTVDADGVALAAIQGLYQELQDRDQQIRQRDDKIADLEARLLKLEQLLQRQ